MPYPHIMVDIVTGQLPPVWVVLSFIFCELHYVTSSHWLKVARKPSMWWEPSISYAHKYMWVGHKMCLQNFTSLCGVGVKNCREVIIFVFCTNNKEIPKNQKNTHQKQKQKPKQNKKNKKTEETMKQNSCLLNIQSYRMYQTKTIS